jgi:hypothetical protein
VQCFEAVITRFQDIPFRPFGNDQKEGRAGYPGGGPCCGMR